MNGNDTETRSLISPQPRNPVFSFLHRNILPIQAAFWMVAFIASEVQYRKELSEKSEGAEIHFAASALGTVGALLVIAYSIRTRNAQQKEDLKYISARQYFPAVLKRMITPPLPCFQDVDLRRFFASSYILTDAFAIIASNMLGKDVSAWDTAYSSVQLLLESTALAGIPNKDTAYIVFGVVVGVPQTYPLVERIMNPSGREWFLLTNIAMVTSCALGVGTGVASHVQTYLESKKAQSLAVQARV